MDVITLPSCGRHFFWELQQSAGSALSVSNWIGLRVGVHLSRALNAVEICAQTTRGAGPRAAKTQLGKWLMGDGDDLNQSCVVAEKKKKKHTISSSFLNEGCAANKHESNLFKRHKARLGYSGSTQISSRLDMLFCHIQSGRERQEGCRLKWSTLVS